MRARKVAMAEKLNVFFRSTTAGRRGMKYEQHIKTFQSLYVIGIGLAWALPAEVFHVSNFVSVRCIAVASAEL